MARRSNPPLYELIMSGRDARSRPALAPARPRRRETGEDVGREAAPLATRTSTRLAAMLGSGRVVRLPVGYVLLGTAAVLLLLVMAFMIGHRRGEQAARADLDREILGSVGLPGLVRDPLLGSEAEPAATVPPASRSEPAQAPNQPASPASPPAAATPPAWGPIDSDPRVDGLHYFVLAEPPPEGAFRLAEFARDRGLETYVISSHNPRLRRVIALPGLTSGSLSDPAVRSLREDILRVGRAWKTKYPGESDLSDAYPSR